MSLLTFNFNGAIIVSIKQIVQQTDEVEIKPVVHVQRDAGDENGVRTQTGKWTTEGSGKSIASHRIRSGIRQLPGE